MTKMAGILKTEEVPTTESGEAESRSQRAKGDYEVGYCRPPVDHQFKVGNKANPKGRKKKTRNRKVVVQELLFEPVKVRDGEEIRWISALEAVIKKTLAKALGGDHKAALTIIGMAQRDGLLTPEQDEALEDLPEMDRAILDHAIRRALPAPPSTGPASSAGDHDEG